MAKTSHTISDGIVHVVCHGDPDLGDLIRAREDYVADPDFRPGMALLVDFTGASLQRLSSSDLRRIGAHGVGISDDLGTYCSATVVSSDADYGVCRMYSVLGARPGFRFGVFRDLDAARAWLAEQRETD